MERGSGGDTDTVQMKSFYVFCTQFYGASTYFLRVGVGENTKNIRRRCEGDTERSRRKHIEKELLKSSADMLLRGRKMCRAVCSEMIARTWLWLREIKNVCLFSLNYFVILRILFTFAIS